MNELDKAYLILDLKPGASLKEIDEARADLLELWNPKRLSHLPRLRAKASDKIQEINSAYRVLAFHATQTLLHRRGESERSEALLEAPIRTSETSPALPVHPSLFLETLGKEASTPRSWTNSRTFVVVLCFVVLGVTILAYFSDVGIRSEGSAQETVSAGTPAIWETESDDLQSGENLESSPHDPEIEGQSPEESMSSSEPTEGTPSPAIRPTRAPSRTQSTPPAAPAKTGPVPVLLREEVLKPPLDGVASETSLEAEANPEQDEERRLRHERAYRILLEQSPAARQVAEGLLESYRFSGWSVARESPTEVWINLSAHRPGWGDEAQLTWAVDLGNQRTRALSQAARDLVADLSRR